MKEAYKAVVNNGDLSIDGIGNKIWVKKASGDVGIGSINPRAKETILGGILSPFRNMP